VARQVRWSPRAASDLEEICDYIARDSEHYAALFASRVVGAVRRIPRFPEAGRVVPEYGDDRLRELVLQNYRIVYRLTAEAIEIVTVCHGARPLRDIAAPP